MTAQEILKSKLGKTPIGVLPEIMIEFAKYHVKKALNTQAKMAKKCMIDNSPVPSIEFLNSCYPLTNIK